MDHALTNLIAASTAFVGSHFALSHPLRRPIVQVSGAALFQVIYSLVALASFAWMVLAFRAVPPAAPLWNGQGHGAGDALWIAASLLTLLAAVLLAGSFFGNPALPDPRAKDLAAQGVRGVFHVTRHPMMWAFALWALSHALVSPTPRSLVLTGAIGFLALVGAHLQDRKKQALMGAAWHGWQARTSYWPRLGGLAKAGALPWLGGLALWLVATWAHAPLNGMTAGLWRWAG
jgi:uncharacterized membrane protein